MVGSCSAAGATPGSDLNEKAGCLDVRHARRHVTSDQFRAGLAEVRAEIASLDTRLSTQIAELRTEQRTGIANLETRLVRWMVGTVIATATLTVGILRLLG